MKNYRDLHSCIHRLLYCYVFWCSKFRFFKLPSSIYYSISQLLLLMVFMLCVGVAACILYSISLKKILSISHNFIFSFFYLLVFFYSYLVHLNCAARTRCAWNLFFVLLKPVETNKVSPFFMLSFNQIWIFYTYFRRSSK